MFGEVEKEYIQKLYSYLEHMLLMGYVIHYDHAPYAYDTIEMTGGVDLKHGDSRVAVETFRLVNGNAMVVVFDSVRDSELNVNGLKRFIGNKLMLIHTVKPNMFSIEANAFPGYLEESDRGGCDKICGNCRFWSIITEPDEKDVADCDRTKCNQDENMIFDIELSADDDQGLSGSVVTGRNFGCKLFVERKPRNNS